MVAQRLCFLESEAVTQSISETMESYRSEGLPRTGYLVPGRDGPGLWPDGRVVGTSSPPPSPSLGNWGLKQF